MSHSKLSCIGISLLLLGACQITQPVDIPLPSDSESSSIGMEEDTFTSTKALQQSCASLQAKTDSEKAKILEEIAQNMDENALDMILGEKCAFLGEGMEIGFVQEDDLLLMDEPEMVYYFPSVEKFVVTFSLLNSVAYIVDKKGGEDPILYFDMHRDEFSVMASMARHMMYDTEDEENVEDVGTMMKEDDHMQNVMMGDDAQNEEMPSDMQHEELGEETGSEDSNDDEEENADDDENDEKEMIQKGVYGTYTSGVIGNGQKSVLFFHAGWCPYCKAHDTYLTDLYGSEEVPLNTYKIDYDSSLDLRKQFGITSQDTFVLIDGNGSVLKQLTFPSNTAVEELLQ